MNSEGNDSLGALDAWWWWLTHAHEMYHHSTSLIMTHYIIQYVPALLCPPAKPRVSNIKKKEVKVPFPLSSLQIWVFCSQN